MQSEKMKTMQTVQCLMAVPSENSVPFESIDLLAYGSVSCSIPCGLFSGFSFPPWSVRCVLALLCKLRFCRFAISSLFLNVFSVVDALACKMLIASSGSWLSRFWRGWRSCAHSRA